MNIGGVNHDDLGRTYRITPIQQPQRSAAFQGIYLSRLPLSPPLIVQFDCWNTNGELMIPYDELPFLVCNVSLETPEGTAAMMVQSEDGPVSMLYGTLVASPSEMRDRSGASGIYFAFPDISVRQVGRFRLKISVLRVTGGQPLDTAYTSSFDVVMGSDYIAPPITDMTRHFDGQNVVRFGLPRSEW